MHAVGAGKKSVSHGGTENTEGRGTTCVQLQAAGQHRVLPKPVEGNVPAQTCLLQRVPRHGPGPEAGPGGLHPVVLGAATQAIGLSMG